MQYLTLWGCRVESENGEARNTGREGAAIEEQDKQVLVGKSKEVNETVATKSQITDLFITRTLMERNWLFITRTTTCLTYRYPILSFLFRRITSRLIKNVLFFLYSIQQTSTDMQQTKHGQIAKPIVVYNLAMKVYANYKCHHKHYCFASLTKDGNFLRENSRPTLNT